MIFQKVKFLNQVNRWGRGHKIELCLHQDKIHLPEHALMQKFFLALNAHDFINYHSPRLNLIEFLKQIYEFIFQTNPEICEIPIPNESFFYLTISYDEIESAQAFIEWVEDFCEHFSETQIQSYKTTCIAIQELYEDVRLGPSTQAITSAAIEQNIPFIRLNNQSLIQFGHGYKQKRIEAANIDSTPYICEAIAQDKELSKKIFISHDVPCPYGKNITTIEEAILFFRTIEKPVVIKPLDGNQGKGVTVNIQTEETLIHAFTSAKKFSDEVLIELHVQGEDYRLLVVGHQMIAAAKREPASIIGDGQLTIQELITLENENPRRGTGHNNVLSRIVIDDLVLHYLEEQELSLESIVAKGQKVFLRTNANLSTGGQAIDVTDKVHQDIRNKAVRVSQAIGLEICGIDLVCQDITKPLENGNGCFIEMNMTPGLRMHIAPSQGTPRQVGQAVARHMYPNDNGRIPIIAVTGVNGKTTTTHLIAYFLKSLKFNVGMTSTEGIYIQDELLMSGDCAGPYSAQTVLMHPDVNVGVFEVARGGILRKGLGFDLADVVVFTNIGQADHLGLEFINTPEDIFEVKKTLLYALKPHGSLVVNIDDPLLHPLLTANNHEIIFISSNPSDQLLKQNHKSVCYHEDCNSIVFTNADEIIKFPLDNILFSHHGKIKFQVMNLMSAFAALWGMGIAPEELFSATQLLVNNQTQFPGRTNILEKNDQMIIVDYGHNYSALDELFTFINTFIPNKKRTIVLSSPGDRANDAIEKQMHLIAKHVDNTIIFQDLCIRNRKKGEIPNLLMNIFQQYQHIQEVKCIENEQDAIAFSLKNYAPDHAVIILIDDIQNSLNTIENYWNQI